MIKDKVYNPEIILEELKEHPHTYETILKDCFTPTLNLILRRKLSRFCKENKLCKSVIPGTRFGKVVFYLLDKKYSILVKNERMGIRVFYYFEYRRLNNFFIRVDEIYELKGYNWEKLSVPMIFSTKDILKVI